MRQFPPSLATEAVRQHGRVLAKLVLWTSLAAAATCGGGPTGPSTSLQVISITPSDGPQAGGTPVTIRGAGFAPGADLLIGGVRATEIVVSSSDQLTATTGAHLPGAADVTVRLRGIEATLRGGFSYLANTPPVIVSLVARGPQTREPERYATPGETIDVTATIQDPDTPESDLAFEWSSGSGSFTGSGSHVTWTAPASTGIVTLFVQVRDPKGSADTQPVSSSVDVAVHDSLGEISRMVNDFLVEFSEQQPPAFVVRNFKEGCGAGGTGKRDEQEQIEQNQIDFDIIQYSLSSPRVTINFGGTCPFRSRAGDACALTDVSWTSKRLTDPRSPGDPAKGSVGTTVGVDQVTAEYLEGRWWLCDSDFDPKAGIRTFMSIK